MVGFGGNIEQRRAQNQADAELPLFLGLNWKHIGKGEIKINVTVRKSDHV